MYKIETKDNTILISGEFKTSFVASFLIKANEVYKLSQKLTIDLSRVDFISTAGIAAIVSLEENENLNIISSNSISEEISNYKKNVNYNLITNKNVSFFESKVEGVNEFFDHLKSFIVLSADTFYFAINGLFNSKGRRKGAIYEQINLMGNNAIAIVALLSILIGLILSLQSAAQLKQFGADIFIVDLIVISMISEMGPMITAIIVAGRSGSSIAAEISTMQITEELDALKVMALNPLKYVVAPKMIAMTISLPLLTILANFVGILGGFIVSVLYLGLNPEIVLDRAISVMTLHQWWISTVKSILFSWVIVLVGTHFGFNVKGGAEGVGRATTSAVVASIFSVIMINALLSLIFYFDF